MMMDKIDFDRFIRDQLIRANGGDDSAFGYVLGEKTYEVYYTSERFRAFVDEMKITNPKAYTSYAKGKGSELEEYREKPPKMASVASSSRFCYLALKDGASALGATGDVEFECSCPIKGVKGTPPQIDACVQQDHLYVEVKCHEIFDPHTVELSAQYRKWIYGKDSPFGLEGNVPIEGTFSIPLSEFGLANRMTSRFDVKQFLCHLMGIASQKSDVEVATLFYLFFKPSGGTLDERERIERVFDELRNDMCVVFSSNPIRKFLREKTIRLRAVIEHDETMQPLREHNLIKMFEVE